MHPGKVNIMKKKNNPSTTYEDKLLNRYFKENGGLVYKEVRLGQGGIMKYPEGATHKRIDAVRVGGRRKPLVPFNKKMIPDFQKTIRGHKVEVIEIKRKLNRLVIGQVIVAAKLMKWEYPHVKEFQQVIVCETCEPVMEKICWELKIKVWKPK